MRFQEGKEILNDEELGGSRSETAAAKDTEEESEKPSPKRDSTMKNTAKVMSFSSKSLTAQSARRVQKESHVICQTSWGRFYKIQNSDFRFRF